MNDLKLWRTLTDQEAIEETSSLPLYQGFSSVPSDQRWVYFGGMVEKLSQQGNLLKAAMLNSLDRITCPNSLQKIAGELDSEDEVVLEEVIKCLEAIPSSIGRGLIHALFSKNPKARVAAIQQISTPYSALLALHLLGEESLRELALEKIHDQTLPVEALPRIRQLADVEIISREETKNLAFTITRNRSLLVLTDSPPNLDKNEIQDIKSKLLAAKSRADAMKIKWPDSMLDWLVDLFWMDETEQPHPKLNVYPRSEWLAEIEDRLPKSSMDCQALFLAFARCARDHRSFPIEYATLLASCDIDFFRLEWIPLKVRRKTARRLLSHPNFVRQQPPDVIHSVLHTDLVRLESGELDLEVIGGILQTAKDPFAILRVQYPIEEISRSFWDRPELGVHLFALPGKTKNKTRLFESICQGKGNHSKRVVAIMLAQIPSVALEVLDHMILGDPLEMFFEVEKVIKEYGFKVSANKYRLIGKSLAYKMLEKPGKFLKEYMSQFESPEKSKLGLEILANLAKEIQASQLVEFVLKLSGRHIKKMLATIDHCDGVPYGVEMLLASVMEKHADATISDWAKEKIAAGQQQIWKRVNRDEMRPLSDKEVHSIATCKDSLLEKKTRFLLKSPVRRLVEALEKRGQEKTSCLNICASLVVCGDDFLDVDKWFDNYSESLNSHALDVALVEQWKHNENLSLLGHVMLWRWEFHLFEFELMVQEDDLLIRLLTLTKELQSSTIQNSIWKATASLMSILAARAKDRLARFVTKEFLNLQIEFLASPFGAQAAKVLMSIHKSNQYQEWLAEIKPQIELLLPSMDPEVRRSLSAWIDSTGMGEQKVLRRATVSSTPVASEPKVDGLTDLNKLKKLCFAESTTIVNDAVLRLVSLGAEGERGLVEVMNSEEPPRYFDIIATSISLWSDQDCLASLASIANDSTRRLSHRYFVALNLIEAGQVSMFDSLVEILHEESVISFFLRRDWKVLLTAGIGEIELATRLATSPQPNAYFLAVNYLIQDSPEESKKRQRAREKAVRAFLESGTRRGFDLRFKSAQWLFDKDDFSALPILLGKWEQLTQNCFTKLDDHQLEVIVKSALTVGRREIEDWIVDQVVGLVERNAIKIRLLQTILQRSTHPTVVGRVVNILAALDGKGRRRKITGIAKSFKWGQEQARQLLNSEFSISMLSGSDLGYTKLKEEKVYINVLPILREQQHGRQIVEGLIVHELGHHIFHKGKNNEKIWEKAQKEGLHSLLNLVADEHLERNLRSSDDDYDVRLKRLGSYAFQHMPRSINVGELLDQLGVHAYEVLTKTDLGFCHDPQAVRIESGKVLMELEKCGSSFARFFRGLRMGLGNRYNDPVVAKALSLFRKNFRKSSMEDLYSICLELKSIFEDEVNLSDSFSHDNCHADDLAREGEGITDHQIEQEIRRIASHEELNSNNGPESDSEKGFGRFINVIDDLDFEEIKQIQKLPFDPLAWSALSKRIAGHGKLLKKFLVGLGQRFETQRRRLSGHRVDRASISRLVTRNDPRVMVSRQKKITNDLFIGVAVDCSGSMDYNDNIETAKKFAAVLAYAVRGIDDIDLRIFGFTDTDLYDAGDEDRPAIHPLTTGAGNNDAAALWHIAQLALASKRKSKLLVMISDGLPTECSVAALQGLVTRLTKKMGICCAQIAVEELEEICFPHYVLVNESDEFASVRKFGRTVASLVKTALKV